MNPQSKDRTLEWLSALLLAGLAAAGLGLSLIHGERNLTAKGGWAAVNGSWRFGSSQLMLAACGPQGSQVTPIGTIYVYGFLSVYLPHGSQASTDGNAGR